MSVYSRTVLDPGALRVSAVEVDFPLPNPIEFGTYVIATRQYSVCSVTLPSGSQGLAWGLSRGAPVAAVITSVVADALARLPLLSPGALGAELRFANPAVLASGIGLRAVSLTELASFDALARESGLGVARWLGSDMADLPATAVVGFPPGQSAEAVANEVGILVDAGWSRFKLPVGRTLDETVRRLSAAREAAPDAWLGLDLAWTARSAADIEVVAQAVQSLDLGWIEDAVPPGNLDEAVVATRRQGRPSAAAGDDDGGPYFLEAALRSGLDVVRVDATCQGGFNEFLSMSARATGAGRLVAPHLFASVHRHALSVAGVDAPVEFGKLGNGVDPFGDLAGMPVLQGGRLPVTREFGFGPLHDTQWLLGRPMLPDSLRAWLESS